MLFLGTSFSYCTIAPALLWEEYGITSYNLSYPQQSIPSIYYFTLEFLQNQTPKVVVLEPESYLYPEEYARYPDSLDNMLLNVNKWNAVQADVEEGKLNYLVPFFRSHDGYGNIQQESFTKVQVRDLQRGYAFLEQSKDKDKENSLPFGVAVEGETYTITEKNRLYMDTLVELLAEKGIPLYLYKAPIPRYSAEKMALLEELASENDLPLRDYNQLADAIGMDSMEDVLIDGMHLNVYGAEKVTHDLGAVLQDTYDLPDRRKEAGFDASSWEEMALYHSRQKNKLGLKGELDATEYLHMLDDEHLVVFLCFRGGAGKSVDDSRQSALETLGIREVLRNQNEEGYIGIFDNGHTIFEQMGPDTVHTSGIFAGASYKLDSDFSQKAASIQINRVEYVFGDTDGLHIAVYDKVLQQVVDRVVLSAYWPHALKR